MFSLLSTLQRMLGTASSSTRTRSVSEGRTTRRRRPPRHQTTRRLLVESLETRAVFDASFGAVATFGSSGYDAAFDVATDTSGNAYSTGYFSGTVDFDPAADHADISDIRTAGGERDVFVMKQALNGSLLWVTQMPGTAGTSTSIARSIAVDAAGNAYVGGDFSGTMSAGASTLTSEADKDAFVAKLAADGTVAWAARYDGLGKEIVDGVAVDPSGNLLAAGYTIKQNADGTFTYSNIQIAKFSPTGSSLWLKQLGNSTGTSGGEAAHAVAADAAGNIVVAGQFRGTVDFDPGSGTHNVATTAKESGFVLKLTPTGGFAWVSDGHGRSSRIAASAL